MRYGQGKPFWFQTLHILLILLILPLLLFPMLNHSKCQAYTGTIQTPNLWPGFSRRLQSAYYEQHMRSLVHVYGSAALFPICWQNKFCFFFWFYLYSLSIYLPHLNTTASKRSTCRDRTCHLQPLRLLGCLCFWIFCDPVLLAIEEWSRNNRGECVRGTFGKLFTASHTPWRPVYMPFLTPRVPAPAHVTSVPLDSCVYAHMLTSVIHFDWYTLFWVWLPSCVALRTHILIYNTRLVWWLGCYLSWLAFSPSLPFRSSALPSRKGYGAALQSWSPSCGVRLAQPKYVLELF